MNRMRLRIAERLKDAQNVNAMLTTFNEIDMRYPFYFCVFSLLLNFFNILKLLTDKILTNYLSLSCVVVLWNLGS